MAAAQFGLGLSSEQGEDIQSLTNALSAVEVESLTDSRFTFVTDDVVDASVVEQFAIGDLSKFRELVVPFAEELIPELALVRLAVRMRWPRDSQSEGVGGGLVFRKLDDYSSSAAGPSVPVGSKPVAPSAAAAKLRESMLT